jgi:hypothetical protein
VKRLSLFHHDPAHTDKEVDRLLSHARRLSPRQQGMDITAAAEGTSVDLGKA